uniref:Uncharacterized protein n=2 Tax=Oryza rufipogon TaxID=4529 RepID=A0A0E0R3Y5_ORYRU
MASFLFSRGLFLPSPFPLRRGWAGLELGYFNPARRFLACHRLYVSGRSTRSAPSPAITPTAARLSTSLSSTTRRWLPSSGVVAPSMSNSAEKKKSASRNLVGKKGAPWAPFTTAWTNTAGRMSRMLPRTVSRGLGSSNTPLSSIRVPRLSTSFTTTAASSSGSTPTTSSALLSRRPVLSSRRAGRNPGWGWPTSVILTSGGPPSLSASRCSKDGHWRPWY